MKNKWYILLFIVLIAISLFAFQYVAELLSDAPRSLSLETQYLLNLPACIFRSEEHTSELQSRE